MGLLARFESRHDRLKHWNDDILILQMSQYI